MSFYVRKSLSAGPFRFNLSKSGIGVSTGFTGFRVGTGPRGNYVHMGRSGLYYKATLPSNKPSKSVPPALPLLQQNSPIEMKEIESVDILQLQDSSSADLLTEIKNKQKKAQLCPIVTLFSFAVFIILCSLNIQVWVLVITIALAISTILFVRRKDQLEKTVILFYELDSEAETTFQHLHDAFREISVCARAWHISSRGLITDLNEQKRQAGAGSLVERKTIRLELKSPPYVSTNLEIPAIPVGKQTLYFFPDRVLVYENGKVGAVSYADIQLEFRNKRFIEAEAVPHDTQIVDHTWKYVNKKGGPDKRFSNNRQLPICHYSELYFKSQSGLNELVQLSKPDLGQTLETAFKNLASVQLNEPFGQNN